MNDLEEHKIKDKNKPYLNHKNAVLSAPIRHLFMIATVEYLKKEKNTDFIDVLEIGSWFGASTLSWGQGLSLYFDNKSSITCIDAWEPFFDMEVHDKKDYALEMENLLESNFAYEAFLHNIGILQDKINVNHIKGKSEVILPQIKEKQYDIIFIDADHTYNPVKTDIYNSLKLLKEGGIICGDDLNLQMHEVDNIFAKKNRDKDFINDPKTKKNYHPGVTLAVHEFFGNVSSWGGFWGMQKKEQKYNKYSLKNMSLVYPAHFTDVHRKKAESHFLDIKDNLF